jgi:hypothetical protein
MKFTLPRIFPRFERRYVYVLKIRPVNLCAQFSLCNPRPFFDLLWCYYLGKVGFESEGVDRAADVQYSIRQKIGIEVKVQRVDRVKVFMYRPIEKAVHNIVRPLHSKHLKGCSGWTEIFKIVNPAFGLSVYILLAIVGLSIAPYVAAVCILIPYPLDMVLYVRFLWFVEWAFIGVAVYVGYLLTITFIGL